MYAYGSTRKSTRLLAEITRVLLRDITLPRRSTTRWHASQKRIALSALLPLRRLIRRAISVIENNDRNDICSPVCPGIIQKGDILLSTKKIASCNGRPDYGNLLRSKSCRRVARSEARNGRGRLPHTLTKTVYVKDAGETRNLVYFMVT